MGHFNENTTIEWFNKTFIDTFAIEIFIGVYEIKFKTQNGTSTFRRTMRL